MASREISGLADVVDADDQRPGVSIALLFRANHKDRGAGLLAQFVAGISRNTTVG